MSTDIDIDQRHYDNSLLLIRQDKLREALIELHKLLKIRRQIHESEPNHKDIAETLVLLAGVYIHLKEYDEAEKYCEEAWRVEQWADGAYQFHRTVEMMEEINQARTLQSGWHPLPNQPKLSGECMCTLFLIMLSAYLYLTFS